MAPIDLPPELPQSQPIIFSRSAADLQIADQGAEPFFPYNHPSPANLDNGNLEPSFSPKTLLPPGQISEPSSEDFSRPNVAQLPSLPSETDEEPEVPNIDEETLDTIDDVVDEVPDIDEEALENVNDTVEELPDLDDETLDTISDTVDEQLAPATVENIDSANIESAAEPLEDLAEPGSKIEPPAATSPTPLDPSKLEITADTQIFDSDRQVVTARGNVVFKLNDAFLLADELWVNLINRYVLAEGNVILTRGEQQVRGERAEYNLLQEAGTIFETRGELFLPNLEDDFSSPTEGAVNSRSVFDPLNPDQDITNVRNQGGFEISSRLRGNSPGSLPESEGGLRRLRFEAARVKFDAETWVAEEVRLTNDPFSPPELEFRTDRMTLLSLSPTADLLTTENPRIVFDQRFALPLLKSKYVLNRGAPNPNQLNPFLINIGSDSRDRGGVFLESEVSIIRNETTNLSITPQYFLERASNQGLTESDVFGFEVDFDTRLSPRSDLSASATLTSLDFDELEDDLRGSIRHRYLIGNHLLSTEYSYRDRLFNGSLGFQDVRSSLGAVLLSPPINLDRRGLILTYQVGTQLVRARTDRTDLLGRRRLGGDKDLVTLGRFQGSARLRKRFSLWRGEPLPATQTEGLRYTPVPLVPFLGLSVNLLGVASYYTSDDFQEELSADVRLDGQIGHLSKNFFDYTRFNLGYSQDILSSDDSPFLFDRNVDRRVISFGVLQQIFGPLLLGFQTSINITTGETVNTDIIAQYSRRTYGLVIRYSPTRETGSIGFRLSDFNWLGRGNPFDEPSIRQVESGIVEER